MSEHYMYAHSNASEVTDDDLKSLIKRAEDSTYGAWVIDTLGFSNGDAKCGRGGRQYSVVRDGDGNGDAICGIQFTRCGCMDEDCPDSFFGHHIEVDQWFNDAAFICEANPKVIKAICEELLRLRSRQGGAE